MPTTPLPVIPQTVSMPLIMAAPAGQLPAVYYSSLPGTVTATDNDDNGLTFLLSQGVEKIAYAVIGGNVSFLPAGQLRPDGAAGWAGIDSVVLALHPLSVMALDTRQPDSLPSTTYFVYQGIDPTTFQAIITNKTAVLDVRVLDSAWRATHTTDPTTISLADKRASYITEAMAGLHTFWVQGGEHLGELLPTLADPSIYRLTFISYEGEVTASGQNQVLAVTPLYFIRFLPEIAQSEVWRNHPLIMATSGFERGAQFYIGFQVSNINSAADPTLARYFGVGAGSQVLLYDDQSTTPVYTAVTNGAGIAYFNLTPAQVTGTQNFYFVINNPTTAVPTSANSTQSLQLPASWATKVTNTRYWMANDGRTKGYLANFKGFRLGNAINPVWFNIGVDYLFEFSHLMPNPTANSVDKTLGSLVKDLTIILKTDSGYSIDHTIGDASIIYGLNFAIAPGDELTFDIPLVLDNPAIGLKRTRIISVLQVDADLIPVKPFFTEHWYSKQDPTTPIYATVTTSSIRTRHAVNTTASRIQIKNEFACGALVSLTYTRELASFLHYMTDGEYTGVELDIKLFHISQTGLEAVLGPLGVTIPIDGADTPLSFPIGSLYLTQKDDERRRELVVHESSHQVFYKVANFDSSDILKRFVGQVWNTGKSHSINLLSDQFLALTEGWSETFGAIFSGFPNDMVAGGKNPQRFYVLRYPNALSVPNSGQDGFYATFTKSPFIYLDELNWLVDKSGDESPPVRWFSLDPYNPTPGISTAVERLNRGENAEGAFTNAMYNIFWDFVVGPTIYQGKRYIVDDNAGDPMRLTIPNDPTSSRTNSWMTPVNRAAISSRFKAFFWEPLKGLAAAASLSEKTSRLFLQGMAEHVNQISDAQVNWAEVRARLLLWNIGFPHQDDKTARFAFPTFSQLPNNVSSGPRAGGNTVNYAGDNFIADYIYKAERTHQEFRSVRMKVYFGGQEATNLVVASATRLSCTVPAFAASDRVALELRLIVRGIEVWRTVLSDAYVYLQ